MEGKLKNWNTDRGFGFIAPTNGGADVFVHIKALPRDGRRPMVGEVLQFDADTDRDGCKRAVNVQRAGQKAMATRAATSARERRGGGGWLGTALSAVFVIALAADGYQQFKSYSSGSAAEAGQKELLSETMRQASTAGFKCDGRTYCSQMTSCAEAKYFLKNCPGVQMDGNHDGKPCEQQWCQ
jgi:cold shock CspA family protein